MGHCNKIETSFLLGVFALFHIAQSALRQILALARFVYKLFLNLGLKLQ
jgi:hypothetical protein